MLWRLDDNQLQKMNGTDYTLYLVYLRYAAKLCGLICVLNLVLMVPIYGSGDPSLIDDWQSNNKSSMNKFTVLNITGSKGKVLFCYVFTILVISGLAYLMLFSYRHKYEGWKKKHDPINEDFDDVAIARYSIFVKHLPVNMGVDELQRLINSKLTKIYPVDPLTGRSAFVKCRVIGDYNNLYKNCVKLKQNMDKLDAVRIRNSQTGERQTITVNQGWRVCCWGVREDAH